MWSLNKRVKAFSLQLEQVSIIKDTRSESVVSRWTAQQEVVIVYNVYQTAHCSTQTHLRWRSIDSWTGLCRAAVNCGKCDKLGCLLLIQSMASWINPYLCLLNDYMDIKSSVESRLQSEKEVKKGWICPVTANVSGQDELNTNRLKSHTIA